MAGSVSAQEPRKSSFDDFVFKTPIAYKTGYSNETARILDIYNEGPYTVFKMEDQIRIIADSAYVFVPFNDMLFDPKTHKEYYIISSTGLPKYEREKYYKGREKPYIDGCFINIANDLQYKFPHDG